nr:aminopeptidase N-like [Lytechinus pictus]
MTTTPRMTPERTEPPVTEPRRTTEGDITTIAPTDGGEDKIFTFDGRVTIHFRCSVPTNVITLHLLDIELGDYTLRENNGNDITISSHSLEEKYEFVHFYLDNALVVGTDYVLYIEYLGQLRAGLSGFYRSSYQEGNETRWLATTQMQPTSARQALPCFDEPDFKAVFRTEIEHRDDMVALSNGMETRTNESEIEGWTISRYLPTPKMSTYLLAFVVGYFDKLETRTDNDILLRVWSRPEAVNNTQYSLDIGSNLTTYFEEYFNISFPLAKQDMIAVPDFSAGAMENWGLIIYRETNLLYDSAVNSASNKQRVAEVVSHELAHMWFGNLVTCVWWDDLWLNEGFATYVEGSIGVNHAEPSWLMREQFVTIDLQSVFEPDALGTSHPVQVPVNHPDEINEIFDSISYSKTDLVRSNNRASRGALHDYDAEDDPKGEQNHPLRNHAEQQKGTLTIAPTMASHNPDAAYQCSSSSPMFRRTRLQGRLRTEIEHRDDMVALSNGMENENERERDRRMDDLRYLPTPKMSTYLLAFVVGYFDKLETRTDNDILVSCSFGPLPFIPLIDYADG